ncbi:MAG: hypothetical protein DMD30_08815 [Gemmatimonadetes bacterium]|nr:MAG: hypothetical protein DMD30_08815 [Gemmatimonadota bacterium]
MRKSVWRSSAGRSVVILRSSAWAHTVSLVVSIQIRKTFAEARKMLLNARDAGQDVRERQTSRNF